MIIDAFTFFNEKELVELRIKYLNDLIDYFVIIEADVTHTGKTHTIDVPNGLTVMEGAVQNDIPGIDADCGGSMACATCHVYVKEEWFDKLKKKEDGEEDMLDMAYKPNKFSRLSCQLIVSDELEGLVVNLPEKQT